MAAAAETGNSGRARRTLRHIRNSLAISSLGRHQFLLRFWSLSIARLGDGRLLSGANSRKSLFYSPPAAPVVPTAAGGGRIGLPQSRRSMCGGGYMATALVDLYGGDDFE